jgi:hypothetical protein
MGKPEQAFLVLIIFKKLPTVGAIRESPVPTYRRFSNRPYRELLRECRGDSGFAPPYRRFSIGTLEFIGKGAIIF